MFIFEPQCETPLYVHEELVDDGKAVMAAILVPTGRVYSHRKQQNWYDKTQLYIIDTNKVNDTVCYKFYNINKHMQ